MKFACFERTSEALYKYILRKPREYGTKTEELAITFIAGYIAGIFCAIVSHPADTIVSKLNNEKGLSLFDAIRRVGFAGKFHFLFVVLFCNQNCILLFRIMERTWSEDFYSWYIECCSIIFL
jgi:hypothetical protein